MILLNCYMEKSSMREIVLNEKMLLDKNTAHEYLKEMLEFPEYYGKNLDALFDCLTELRDAEIVIKIQGRPEGYLKKLIPVFFEAADENNSIKITII